MVLTKLKGVAAVLVLVTVSIGFAAGLLTRPTVAAQQGRAEEPPVEAGKKAKEAADKPKAGKPVAKIEDQGKADKEDRILPGDRLLIEASNTLPGSPIKGVFRVEVSGKVALGSAYGRVSVQGLTPEEAESVILRHLRTYLRDPQVLLTRYDALANRDGAGQGPALEQRIEELAAEVRALRSLVEKLLKQRRE